MRTGLIAMLLLLGSVLPAGAGIETFIDDHTTFAAEVDLAKADLEALDKWVAETYAAAGLFAPDGPGLTKEAYRTEMDRYKRWINDARAQGATVMYVVANEEQTPYLPFVVIVPVEDAKAPAMASLLYSGKTTGPSKPEQTRENRGQVNRRPVAEEVPGVGAMFGVAERINKVRELQPKPRPDIEAAFKSAGQAPVRLVIAPTPGLQGSLRGAPAPLITFLGNTKWLVATFNGPPEPSAKAILQAKDVEAAKQLQQMIVMWAGMGVASGSGLTPEFTKLMTPTAQGDQVVIALDGKQIVSLAAEMKGPVQMWKRQAQRVASMSNIRQLLMGCMMYKAENKGAWPNDLNAIARYVRGKDVMTNPVKPELKPAYVYFKPTEPILEAGKHVVIHEAYTEFGEGVNVGFADGHVEFVNNRTRFDELIAGTAQAAQP